jgi:hypothetical protein
MNRHERTMLLCSHGIPAGMTCPLCGHISLPVNQEQQPPTSQTRRSLQADESIDPQFLGSPNLKVVSGNKPAGNRMEKSIRRSEQLIAPSSVQGSNRLDLQERCEASRPHSSRVGRGLVWLFLVLAVPAIWQTPPECRWKQEHRRLQLSTKTPLRSTATWSRSLYTSITAWPRHYEFLLIQSRRSRYANTKDLRA